MTIPVPAPYGTRVWNIHHVHSSSSARLVKRSSTMFRFLDCPNLARDLVSFQQRTLCRHCILTVDYRSGQPSSSEMSDCDQVKQTSRWVALCPTQTRESQCRAFFLHFDASLPLSKSPSDERGGRRLSRFPDYQAPRSPPGCQCHTAAHSSH